MASQIVMVALLLSCGASSGARATDRQLTAVLIVSGISKDAGDQAARLQAVAGLRDQLLQHAGVEPRKLTILTADKPDAPAAPSLQSTASQLAQTIETLAATMRPEDRFIFCYLGQANAADGELRFNLPGPDMTQKELADRLKTIKASTQLIVLDCPCAGVAAKTLSGPNRIVVCASAATQPLGTQFSPHLVRVMAQPKTDADSDGKVSLLEAFAATAREIEQWYRQQNLLPTETPCLEDDGDGTPSERPWRYQTQGGDGLKASTFWLVEGH